MKKLLSILSITTLSAALLPSAASASSQVIIYPQTVPSSTQSNLGFRLQRLSQGTFIRDALGPTAIAGGVYSNLSVVPNGGNNLAVQPTNNALGNGTLYQLGPLDALPLPQSQSSQNQLPADTTPIAVEGLQPASIGGLGPITAPATGSSLYVLVEGQVQTRDTTPLLFPTISASGGHSSEVVNSQRQDAVVYQLKYGTASATPAQPLVDSGWIPLAYVFVAAGTGAITSNMITAVTPFAGFAQNGLAGSFKTLKINNTTAGCLQSDNSGNVTSQTCTSGLGVVNGTAPVTASTVNGVATVGLSHGDYTDTNSAQTVNGAKTLTAPLNVGGGTTGILNVSTNPATSSGNSPQIYVSQNVSGGAKFGLDSYQNNMRLLYTPFGSSNLSVLGYFDSAGTYHNGGTSLGVNTTIQNTLQVNGVLGVAGTTTSSGLSYAPSFLATGTSVYAHQWNTPGAGGGYAGIGAGCGSVGGISATVLGVNLAGAGCLHTLDAVGNSGFAGNVVSGTGNFAAPSGARAALCASYNCSGPSLIVDTGGNASLTSSGLFTTGAAVYGPTSGYIPGDLRLSRADGTGALFLGQGTNHYLYWDGSYYQMPTGGLNVGGSGTFNGLLDVVGNNNIRINGVGIIGSNNGQTAQGVGCSLIGFAQNNVGWKSCLDTAGNFGINGALYTTGLQLNGNGTATGGLTMAGLHNTSSSQFDGAVTVGGGLYITNSGLQFSGANTGISLPGGITAGSAQINGPANVTGGLSVGANLAVAGAASVGATSYITRGTNATYPFLAGVYNGNAHIEQGRFAIPAGAASAGRAFNTAYSGLPICTVSWDTANPTGSPVTSTSTTGSIVIYGTAGINADYICIGA